MLTILVKIQITTGKKYFLYQYQYFCDNLLFVTFSNVYFFRGHLY